VEVAPVMDMLNNVFQLMELYQMQIWSMEIVTANILPLVETVNDVWMGTMMNHGDQRIKVN